MKNIKYSIFSKQDIICFEKSQWTGLVFLVLKTASQFSNALYIFSKLQLQQHKLSFKVRNNQIKTSLMNQYIFKIYLEDVIYTLINVKLYFNWY